MNTFNPARDLKVGHKVAVSGQASIRPEIMHFLSFHHCTDGMSIRADECRCSELLQVGFIPRFYIYQGAARFLEITDAGRITSYNGQGEGLSEKSSYHFDMNIGGFFY
jgi:hypothetical protein